MRTIIVIFTERKLSLNEMVPYKRYKFLCNYDTVSLYDITCNGVGVYQHNTVQYAGVVYFRNREDAIKAVKILGKRVKSLFD